MSAKEIMQSDLFKKCLTFHGHFCPGLSTGYQAAVVGMEWLSANRSEDEEIVTIVETDACCCDAIQVITGCTFGKGNFIYKDYGKMAFTFMSRDSGKGVRISLKPMDASPKSKRHAELMNKFKTGQADKAEIKEFRKLHTKRAEEILNNSPKALFHINEVNVTLPPKATMAPSVQCDRCGEPTMATKLKKVANESICRGCLKTVQDVTA